MSITPEAADELHRCARRLAAGELPPGWQALPGSTFTRVACNPQLQIHYEEFQPRNSLERLKSMLLGSRATRTRKHSSALLYAGIEAPAYLAWGRLPGGIEYLFARAAAGRPVSDWLQATRASNSPETLATRRQLLEGLGVFIGRLHATGFVHGDLRPGNILANLHEDRFHFTLLGNDRTVRKIPPPGRMLLRNLMQLNMLPPAVLGKTDRMRFFVAWRRQLRELSPIEAKLLAAEAYHWAMRRMYEKGRL